MHFNRIALRSLFLAASPYAVCVVAWFALSSIQVLPNLSGVLGDLLDRAVSSSRFYSQGAATLWRTLLTFVFAAVIGVAIAMAPGPSFSARRGLDGLIDFLRSIPAPVLLPVFMSVFGLYSAPKLALAIFGCSLVNVVYTSFGIKREAGSLRSQMARSFGGSWPFTYFKVVLPGAVADIVAGLRVTLSLALVLTTLAELFLMTGEGWGVAVRIAYEDRQHETMYSHIIALGILGLGLNRLYERFEAQILRFRKGI